MTYYMKEVVKKLHDWTSGLILAMFFIIAIIPNVPEHVFTVLLATV